MTLRPMLCHQFSKPTMKPTELQQKIADSFSLNEIKVLCFELGIEYEELSGDTRGIKSLELVKYCERRNRFDELVIKCIEMNPGAFGENRLQQSAVQPHQTTTVLESEARATHFTRLRVTEHSPLYVGLVIDFSRSMKNAFLNQIGNDGTAFQDLRHAVDEIILRSVAYCKTPESDIILPRLRIFSFGYGFGEFRKRFASIMQRLGIASESDYEAVPSSSIRDLFLDAHLAQNLPVIPTATELNRYRTKYRKSIEAHFVDSGLGRNNLYECLKSALDRFRQELDYSRNPHSVLILISTGRIDDATDPDLDALIHAIHAAGIVVICLYVSSQIICESRKLYINSEPEWPSEAQRLFSCASSISEISEEGQLIDEVLAIAREFGWDIVSESRLFIQLNSHEVLGELCDFVLNPVIK